MRLISIAPSHNSTPSSPGHDPTIDRKSQANTHMILLYTHFNRALKNHMNNRKGEQVSQIQSSWRDDHRNPYGYNPQRVSLGPPSLDHQPFRIHFASCLDRRDRDILLSVSH
jgi:hypothetical protein